MSNKELTELPSVLKYFNDWETEVKDSNISTESKDLMLKQEKTSIHASLGC